MAWPRCCLGIGATRSLPPAPLDHGGAASAVTISRADEFLSKDQQTIAFALPEMEYLRQLIAEHKRNIPAVFRRVDGASLVDTDDTNSMGARHRDDTEGV